MQTTKPLPFKYITLLIILIWTGFRISAQDSLPPKKHELAFDIVPLLNNTIFRSPGYHYNPYQLLYRYHFDKWSLRARVGAYIDHGETIKDSIKDYSEVTQLEGSLGIERKVNLYKQFQIFYGLDFFTRYAEYKTRTEQTRVAWDSRFTKSNDYGVAPFLGFRYKLNNRLSITTETNWRLFYTHYLGERRYFPDNQYGTKVTSKEWNTEYTPPTSIYITFNF